MTVTYNTHYRKDNPKGITPPDPDGDKDIVAHITKHRGMKTPYTSVSEDQNSINHFSGILYKTEPNQIIGDKHKFKAHSELMDELRSIMATSSRKEKIYAQRAFMLASRAKEALVEWEFILNKVKKKDRINWCYYHIQKYFRRVEK